jgi:DNA-binding GntR family transcriptional regulator
MTDSPAAPVSRGDGIHLALREAIMESALAPGTKLPEDALGKSFGASRTIVRAALARLASEGLVEVGKTKSARVAHPGRDEAREVFTVRRALERSVVALLADTWSPSYAPPIQSHIDAEAQASAAADHKLSVRLGAEFHILLAELTGNRLLLRYVNEIVGRSTLILAVYGAAHPQADSLREHEQLLAAMAAGDAALAGDIVEGHIHSVEGRALIPDDTVERSLGEVLARYSSGSRPG